MFLTVDLYTISGFLTLDEICVRFCTQISSIFHIINKQSHEN
jgi:hypothetical protein